MSEYSNSLVSAYDMSTVPNVPDLGWKENGNDGVCSNMTVAANVIDGVDGGKALTFDGVNEKVNMGDVGTIRAVAMWVRPDTNTEEIFKTAAGRDVMVNAGVVTYTGVAALATYVNGVATTAMVADVWQHLVCVFDADEAANDFEIATDGANFGDIDVDSVQLFGDVLTGIQAADIWNATRRGMWP